MAERGQTVPDAIEEGELRTSQSGRPWGLHTLPEDDPAVYRLLAAADTVGVFQVESRAQMATLPRLRPRTFYDIVVEVALIRPGPIQGDAVTPYIRRRLDREEITYLHDSLKPALAKTLGVPLFQEQLMQLATDVAGFSPAEADQLRRAMGSKRSTEKMEQLRQRFYDGARHRHGIEGEVADRIFEKLAAFANFGFPESHSQSFASLVFYSSWFKLYHPAAFCAALLRAQPMGFYSPQSLVADARRHGVTVHGPCVNRSLPWADLENAGAEVRLGLAAIRTIGDDLAERIAHERDARGAYAGLTDLTARVELTVAQSEALATSGALDCFGRDRRQALWEAGAAARERPDRLPGTATAGAPSALPGMSETELAAADVWATSVTVGKYPTEFLRPTLDRLGVVPADRLLSLPDGDRVLVGGAVTHRQRPATAGGVTFINLEDETGMHVDRFTARVTESAIARIQFVLLPRGEDTVPVFQAADEARIRARLGDVSRTWDEDVLSAAAAAGADAATCASTGASRSTASCARRGQARSSAAPRAAVRGGRRRRTPA